jgi:hypothetical protein
MNNGRKDCQRISRRAALAGTAPVHGGLRVAGAAEDQPSGRQISGYAEGRSALRWLCQFSTAERVQIRRRRHQPERVVPVVCPQAQVLTASAKFVSKFVTAPGAAIALSRYCLCAADF